MSIISLYQLLFLLPAIINFYNKKIAKVTFAIINVTLISLSVIEFIPIQPNHILIIIISLILLVNPKSNPLYLSMITLISGISIKPVLSLAVLALLLFLMFSNEERGKRLGFYLLMVVPLTVIFLYSSEILAMILIGLMLIGAPPLHKWLTDAYSKDPSVPVLISLIVLIKFNSYVVGYLYLTPTFLIFGMLMMFVGMFQCMVCRNFSELFSSLHLLIFSIMLLSSQIIELEGMFYYLVLPFSLGFSVIHSIHGNLAKSANKEGILDFGGLSDRTLAGAISTLIIYLIFFSLLSMCSEILMHIGIKSNIGFLITGCIALFISAASLAVFFRNYTLIFEGFPKTDVSIKGSQNIIIPSLSAMCLFFSLFPQFSLKVLSLFGGIYPAFDDINILLLIIFISTLLSIAIMKLLRVRKVDLWTTGYASTSELKNSHGEIFALWGDIFRPIYAIAIPDEKVVNKIGRIHAGVLLLMFVILVVGGAML